MKRIGIDARFYGPLGKGLGRYTKEIVDRITSLDRENEYVIFLCAENFNEFQSADPRIKKVMLNARWYTLAEQLALPYYILREKIDLMHFPHFNVPIFCPSKFIVTIHDLILTKFPTERASTLSPLLYKIKNFAYRIVIRSAIKRALSIIAVSEFTKHDIVSQFGDSRQASCKILESKILVTYEGVFKQDEPALKNNDKNVLLSYNIHSPFFLYVGNAYPHKNLEGLIDVFSELRKNLPDISLVLVGKEDYFYCRLKAFVENDPQKFENITFPGYVPDNGLVCLYKNASAYIFPSFYEGFGLPPLEAMANGCPVVSSDRSCLPEILGEAALFFDPADKDDMKNKLERILADNDLRAELIAKGLRQAEKYSWEKCAQETLRIYQSS